MQCCFCCSSLGEKLLAKHDTHDRWKNVGSSLFHSVVIGRMECQIVCVKKDKNGGNLHISVVYLNFFFTSIPSPSSNYGKKRVSFVFFLKIIRCCCI